MKPFQPVALAVLFCVAASAVAETRAAAMPDRLPPMVITAPRYGALVTPLERIKVRLFLRWQGGLGWPLLGDHFVITPGHVPQRTMDIAFTTTVIDGAALRHLAAVTPDGALASLAGLNLAGRRDGSSARLHDQTVSLRGVEANAGGVRLLLDGVPLNDPFGGWAPWHEVPRLGLIRAEIVPGGGATAWGESTVGGVAQLFTVPATGQLVTVQGKPNDGGPADTKLKKQVVRGKGQLTAAVGDFGTRSTEFVADQPTRAGVLQLLGRDFSTQGFALVAPEKRGPIDIAGWSRHRWLTGRWRQPLGPNCELTVTIRDAEVARGNGTPYQQERAHSRFLSLAVAGASASGFAWNGVAYVQSESYADRFSAVDPRRAAETPVYDRFAVPATAFGAAWTGAWWHSGYSRTIAGLELRFVQGESRENSGYADGGFSRTFVAGGRQGDLGWFVLHQYAPSTALRATLGLRVDTWIEAAGRERETSLVTGALRYDHAFGSERGTVASPSVGVVWHPAEAWRLRLNAQQSFRRPTLSERYQTVGSDAVVVLPERDLRPERNTSYEVGAEYHVTPAFRLSATAFANDIRDSIGQQTVPRGGSEWAGLASLPSGYSVRKRVNLDRARARGLELQLAWTLGPSLSVEATARVGDATICRATAAPALVGQRLRLVPDRTAGLSVSWRPAERAGLHLRVRGLGRQYDDNENTLRLGAAVAADLGATFALSQKVEVYLSAGNLSDARIEISKSVDGIGYLGSPRCVMGGVRVTW